MDVFLSVLKIAGIVLGSVAGLVLFIILLIVILIFTVPVKYEGHLELADKSAFEIKVHWLLNAVYARLALSDDGKVEEVRLLGKEIELGGGMTIDMVLDFLFPPVDDATFEKENENDLPKGFKADFERAVAEEADFIDEEASPDTVFTRIADFFLRKTEKLREKYQKLKRQKRFLQRERTKRALKRIWEFIVKVIRIVFPKELSGVLHIGFDNPDDTGSFLAGAAILLPVTQDHLEIQPDFEESVLEGTLDFATSVRIGGLVVAAVRFVLDKDVRYFMSRVRKYL